MVGLVYLSLIIIIMCLKRLLIRCQILQLTQWRRLNQVSKHLSPTSTIALLKLRRSKWIQQACKGASPLTCKTSDIWWGRINQVECQGNRQWYRDTTRTRLSRVTFLRTSSQLRRNQWTTEETLNFTRMLLFTTIKPISSMLDHRAYKN